MCLGFELLSEKTKLKKLRRTQMSANSTAERTIASGVSPKCFKIRADTELHTRKREREGNKKVKGQPPQGAAPCSLVRPVVSSYAESLSFFQTLLDQGSEGLLDAFLALAKSGAVAWRKQLGDVAAAPGTQQTADFFQSPTRLGKPRPL